MKQVWWKEAVAYQVYPRSFKDSNGDGIGDLQGIISKLDYLQDMGINLLWISPFFKSPNDDNGYDISDYEDILEEFGTMADFDQLLEDAHNRNIKIVMDLVINHSSDEHQWFIESRSSKDSPKRDWYIWRDGKNGEEPNNWESIFHGSAWEYDEHTDQYYLHIFSRKQPDLNWENKEVRQALYDMMNRWLDKGIDGFRIDAISHIKKDLTFSDMPPQEGMKYVPSFDKHMNMEGIQTFLQELKEQTYSKYDVVTIGEANGVSADEAEVWVGEKEGKMDMLFQFEHMDLWNPEVDAKLDVVQLKKILTKWQKKLENKGWNALYLENHDKTRIVSNWGEEGIFWDKSAKSFAMMYFFMQGTPFIYQGQEIGMKNIRMNTIEEYNDIGTRNLYEKKREQGIPHEEIMKHIWATSRESSRTPMQWTNDVQAGFTTGTPWLPVNENYKEINVENQLEDEFSILNFYKKMIKIKQSNLLYTYGIYDLLLEEDPHVYCYTRTNENEKVVVISNLTNETTEISLPFEITSENLLLANYDVEKHNGENVLKLRPFEARMYEVSKSN